MIVQQVSFAKMKEEYIVIREFLEEILKMDEDDLKTVSNIIMGMNIQKSITQKDSNVERIR